MTLQIVVIDIESTGKEKATDQIIEICIQFGVEPGSEARVWRIKPSIPIHPEATAVHHITMADLEGCPSFIEAASEFIDLIMSADVIVGYNVAFDLDMIQAEIARAELPPLDLSAKQIVDVLRLWHYVEPRTLGAAHEKFCKEPLDNAHQALADVAGTARILASMLEIFKMTDKTWPEIASVSDPFRDRRAWIGPSHHIQWDANGAVVFGFGKNKGCQVLHVDGGFLRWMMAKDFPPHVVKICKIALERRREFDAWISTWYPRPVVAAPVQQAEAVVKPEIHEEFSLQVQEALP